MHGSNGGSKGEEGREKGKDGVPSSGGKDVSTPSGVRPGHRDLRDISRHESRGEKDLDEWGRRRTDRSPSSVVRSP